MQHDTAMNVTFPVEFLGLVVVWRVSAVQIFGIFISPGAI